LKRDWIRRGILHQPLTPLDGYRQTGSQAMQTGVLTILRFLFAFLKLGERYRFYASASAAPLNSLNSLNLLIPALPQAGNLQFIALVCLSFFRKKQYEATLSESINTAIKFQNTTGRDRINNP
jgi:hypothetical protein